MEEANKSASDVSKLKDILSSILLICKVFYSLNFQVSWNFTELKAVFLLKQLLFLIFIYLFILLLNKMRKVLHIHLTITADQKSVTDGPEICASMTVFWHSILMM